MNVGASTATRRRPRRPYLDVSLTAGGALVGAAALSAVSVSSAIAGPWMVALVVACALGIPLARHLAARVLYLVPLLSAYCYVLWLVPARLPQSDILTATIGAVLGGAAGHGIATGTLRRLVPAADVVDLVAVPLTAAVAVANFRTWVLSPTTGAAFNVYSSMWDNSSHYWIVSMMRSSGTLLHYLPASPDGSLYALTAYPAAFHATDEAFLTYLLGHAAAAPQQVILAFIQSSGLLAVTTAVLAACAVACLPGVRANPFAAAVGAGLAGSVMCVGPGAIGVGDGQYNFQFTLAMVLAAMSVAVGVARVWEVRRVAVLVAAIVMAAGGWLPLGALAAGAAATILLPFDRRRWVGRPVEIVAAAVLVVAGAAISYVQLTWVLGGIDPNARDAAGGLTRVIAGQFALALTGVVLAVLWAVSRGGRRGRQLGVRSRYAAVGVTLLLFAGAYFYLALDQLRTLGKVMYYPQKLENGFVTMALCYLAMGVALAGARALRNGTRRVLAAAAALVAGAVALFAFGLPVATPLMGNDVPNTPASFTVKAIRDRPELLQSLSAVQDVPKTVPVAVMLTLQSGQSSQDTAMIAATRGTYTNNESKFINFLAAGNPSSIRKIASLLGPDLRAHQAVIVTTAAMAGELRAALPGVPAGSILSV